MYSVYPALGLHDLQRVGCHGGRQAGRHPEQEGLPAVQVLLLLLLLSPHSQQQRPLEPLVDGELDGRVGDQGQGGQGAAPQGRQTFLTV